MNPMRLATIAIATIALGVSACASGPRLADSQKLELYQQNAGEPVSKIKYYGSLRGWEPIGDSALVVWVRGDEGYLFTLDATCPDLPFGKAIRVGDQSGDVYAGLDSIRVLGGASSALPCRIRTIQPLDRQQVRADEKALRQALGGT